MEVYYVVNSLCSGGPHGYYTCMHNCVWALYSLRQVTSQWTLSLSGRHPKVLVSSSVECREALPCPDLLSMVLPNVISHSMYVSIPVHTRTASCSAEVGLGTNYSKFKVLSSDIVCHPIMQSLVHTATRAATYECPTWSLVPAVQLLDYPRTADTRYHTHGLTYRQDLLFFSSSFIARTHH